MQTDGLTYCKWEIHLQYLLRTGRLTYVLQNLQARPTNSKARQLQTHSLVNYKLTGSSYKLTGSSAANSQPRQLQTHRLVNCKLTGSSTANSQARQLLTHRLIYGTVKNLSTVKSKAHQLGFTSSST
jgi:hypothetical protein